MSTLAPTWLLAFGSFVAATILYKLFKLITRPSLPLPPGPRPWPIIEKLKGCDKGNPYEFELRKDLLELVTCGHRNILQFCGVCVDDNHGLCVVTKYMEGGSVHDLMSKNKKLQTKDIVRIAVDVAEGVKFMNDHGVAYRNLNTQRILLDKHVNACLGDMGIVNACRSVGEAIEYETDGYRWLALEFLKVHDANFSSRPPNAGAKYMAYSYQDLVFASYGPHWRLRRKISSIHMFSGKALHDFTHLRQDEKGHAYFKLEQHALNLLIASSLL